MLKYKRKICTEYTGTLGDTLLVGSNLNSDLQRGYCLGTCSCIGVWFEMNPEKEREGFIPSTHLVGEEEEEKEEGEEEEESREGEEEEEEEEEEDEGKEEKKEE